MVFTLAKHLIIGSHSPSLAMWFWVQPRAGTLPLVRHPCNQSAPQLMPSPTEIANTAVSTCRAGNPRFWGRRKKSHPGTLVMNLDT
jgi:hypothetical protein